MTAKTRLWSRVRKWLALVVACALPLEAFIWNKGELLRQQFAVLLGGAIWVCGMSARSGFFCSRRFACFLTGGPLSTKMTA